MSEVIYDSNSRTGTVGENTSATFRELKKLIKSEKNISGDITIKKIGISEISNGKFNIKVEYDLDGELMEIDLPFENCKDLSACKNARKALDKINGVDTKKMDLKNLITLFMCMVCESEEERAKTLQQVSNQMGIANLNFALEKRELDRYAAEKQCSSSKLEAWGTIAKSSIQLAAIGASAIMMLTSKTSPGASDVDKKIAQKQLQQKIDLVRGLGDAIGGIMEGGFKLGAAGEKYDADIAKADKEHIDATMNLINNLWSNFRQDFSAALNRVDKTASILKEAIDALLQTNTQISRNI